MRAGQLEARNCKPPAYAPCTENDLVRSKPESVFSLHSMRIDEACSACPLVNGHTGQSGSLRKVE